MPYPSASSHELAVTIASDTTPALQFRPMITPSSTAKAATPGPANTAVNHAGWVSAVPIPSLVPATVHIPIPKANSATTVHGPEELPAAVA